MKQAIDLDTNRLVDAEEVSARGTGTFKCPCCFDTVQLISPADYDSYFRHLHGTYRSDCENYQVGKGGGDTEGGSGDGRWLTLYAITSIHPSTQSWWLEMFVPDPGPALGVAHYKDAGGERTLRSLKSSQGGRRIPVLPQETDYRVDFGPKNSTSRRRLEIPGLERKVGNVFHYGDVAGRRLGTSESLVLGESYVVISHSSARLQAIDRVSTLLLGQNAEWIGSIVTLPADLSPSLRAWCLRAFRRLVVEPDARLTLIFPPSAAMVDDGTWAISNDFDALYLACDGPVGAYTPEHIGWKRSHVDRTEWLSLEGSLPAFLSLSSRHKSWYEVLLRDQGQGALELLVGDQTALRFPPGATVLTRVEPNREPSAYPLFSPQATSHLQAVREGKEEFVSITSPPELPVTITARGPADRLWHVLSDDPQVSDVVDKANESEPSGTHRFNGLGAALSQIELSLRIDAGNFGFVELLGTSSRVAPSSYITIQGRLRHRIIWLLAMLPSCEAAVNITAQPLGFRFADDVFCGRIRQTDRPLIMKFLNVNAWPCAFVAHARVAARELLQLVRKGA
jgi:hypothetical protein